MACKPLEALPLSPLTAAPEALQLLLALGHSISQRRLCPLHKALRLSMLASGVLESKLMKFLEKGVDDDLVGCGIF